MIWIKIQKLSRRCLWKCPWWRHQVETFSALLALCVGNSPVTGGLPSQRPVTRSFLLRLNKRLSKQLWGWWFETPSHPLWSHCNAQRTGRHIAEYIIKCIFLKQIFRVLLKMTLKFVPMRHIDNDLNQNTWWRHQMETFSALRALCAGNSPVTGEFLAQRRVTRSFDVSCDLRLITRLCKQSWGWCFETPSAPIMTSP